MRNIYEPLNRLRGWFSPLLDLPAWFSAPLVTDEVVHVFMEATEEPDIVGVTVTTVVTLDVLCTEGVDTCTAHVTTGPEVQPPAVMASGPYLGSRRPREPVQAWLVANEGRDRASVRVSISAGQREPPPEPSPTLVPVAPAAVPEPASPPQPEPVPAKVPVLMAMRVSEQADSATGTVHLTDWITYDNEALLSWH